LRAELAGGLAGGAEHTGEHGRRKHGGQSRAEDARAAARRHVSFAPRDKPCRRVRESRRCVNGGKRRAALEVDRGDGAT